MTGDIAGHKNQFVAGASGDFGDTGFTQRSQTADFTVNRDTIGTGPYLPETDVGSTNHYLGAYLADTLALADRWTLTLAGRYNYARIAIADRSGEDPGLDGSHTFSRFNPALGITSIRRPRLTAHAAYNEGMRRPDAHRAHLCQCGSALQAAQCVPSPIRRCRSGAPRRSRSARAARSAPTCNGPARCIGQIWTMTSSSLPGAGAANVGYFQNVGQTRRQGIELMGSTH
jgi:outer membrane receptor protein involved in Fe transport